MLAQPFASAFHFAYACLLACRGVVDCLVWKCFVSPAHRDAAREAAARRPQPAAACPPPPPLSP